MSFWLDDDDYNIELSQQSNSLFSSQQQQQSSLSQETTTTSLFVCVQCGGSDSYQDETTGRQVCAVCFTESQQHSQSQSQETSQLDYEDIMGLAAKNTRGTLVRHYQYSTAAASGRQHLQTKEPLEKIDKSVPLPDLETCLTGFQTVLYECAERLIVLLLNENNDNHNDASSFRSHVHATVRHLWNSYLQAWADGAQHYGQMYPNVRFSLRDAFVRHPQHRSMIMSHLTYQATQAAAAATAAMNNNEKKSTTTTTNEQETNKEGASSTARQKRKQAETSHVDQDEEISNDDDDKKQQQQQQQQQPDPNSKRRRRAQRNRIGQVSQILQAHTSRRIKTYRDMALHVSPSMNLAAAILFLSVYRCGRVTLHQMCHWIRNGSLPLLNAFKVLSARQQQVLRPIAYFFVQQDAPSHADLERIVTQTAVACRLKLKRRQQPDLVVVKTTTTTTTTGRQQEKQQQQLVSVQSVPMIMAQLVANLHLGQGVLDRSLALLGVASIAPKESNEHDDDNDGSANTTTTTTITTATAPSRPSFTTPDRLTRLPDVLAVLAIACFLDPHWREWSYAHGPTSVIISCRQKRRQTNDDRPEQRNHHHHHRFVPWTEEQLRALGNGRTLDGYLDFLEEFLIDGTGTVGSDFVEMLKDDTNSKLWNEAGDDEDSDIHNDDDCLDPVRPFAPMAGVPLRPMTSSSHSTTTKKKKQPKLDFTKIDRARIRSNVEVDPQQRMLLEFLAHATHVEVSQIQSSLDKLLA